MGSAMTLGFLDGADFFEPINLEGGYEIGRTTRVPFLRNMEILEWKNNLFLISSCLSFILIRTNFHSTKVIVIDQFERLELKF